MLAFLLGQPCCVDSPGLDVTTLAQAAIVVRLAGWYAFSQRIVSKGGTWAAFY